MASLQEKESGRLLPVVPQFITGDFTAQRVFLEDREYGLALDALVKGCSDILVLSSCGSKVLLGCRKVEPQPDWWFIGGRARPGDTTREAARRNVKRELGLDLPVSRFEAVATYSMVWQLRAQAPAHHGTADISTVHLLTLTEGEEERVALDPQEYSASRYVPLDDVVAGEYHPCLKQAVKDARKLRASDCLVAAAAAHQEYGGKVASADGGKGGASGGGSELAAAATSVLKAALAYAEAHNDAGVGTETTHVRFTANRKYEHVLKVCDTEATDEPGPAFKVPRTSESSV